MRIKAAHRSSSALTHIGDNGIWVSHALADPALSLNFLAGRLDPRITFTRTSAATFVGSNGLIQNTPASRNLLTFTQEFDNAAWTKLNASVTANSAVAPDGTTTADKLMVNTTNGQHNASRTAIIPTGTTATISVFAKAAELSWLAITDNQAFGAWFDLANGVTGSSIDTIISKSITSFGNGWYRCSVTFTSNASNSGIAVIATNANNVLSFAGANTTDGIYIWGAQIEAASAATTYTRNNGGRFPPRFDYDPVTLAPKGLMIEEQRTNLLTYSEQFNNAAWLKFNSPTITANDTSAPDGTTTAERVTATSATKSTIYTANSLVGAASTFSMYAKFGTARFLFMEGVAGTPELWFDLQDGTISSNIGTGVASIKSFGNGWYLCSVSVAVSASNVSFGFTNTSGASSQTIGQFSWIWGAQLEAGAFATSYIPTVASQVTRSADVATMTGTNFSSWYNQSEGTLFVEATIPTNVDGDSANYYVASTDGTNNNRILIAELNGTTSQIVIGGALQFSETVGAEPTGIVKAALAYAANNAVSSANGAIGTTDTSVSIPTVNRLNIGVRGDLGGNTQLNGHIRQIAYYNTRLPNAVLQGITS